jgi:N-acetylglucosamine-6-phosphate deacetylase
MTSKLLHNATVYADDSILEDGWVLVQGARVARVGQGALPALASVERIDLRGQALAPGFIDIHVHGALGHDTMDATPPALQEMARFYARHGVTGFLATTMSNPPGPILAALQNIALVQSLGTGGAALLGAHVEGPYLDPERAGAQDPGHIRRAQVDEYRNMFHTGVVKVLTLAPEYSPNQELIPFAVAHGAAVAAGHTRASYDEMCRAVELGVTQVTHLFNGMEALHHRKPGVVGAGLSLDALRCQLIADNIHIHPAVLKLAVRAKGLQGILLVSDAMSGTGMPDGDYDLGGQAVTVRDGVARIAAGAAEGALAGSTLTMERAVHNIMAATGLSLAEALTMASRNPALAIGLHDRKGSIAVDKDADLIALDGGLNVTLTMVAGEIVYRG